MEIGIIDDVLKFHYEFDKKIKEQVEAVGKGRGISKDVLTNERKLLLKRFSDSLKATKVAKEKAVKRYDQEIHDNEKMISRLKKEISDEKNALKLDTTKVSKKSKEKK